MIDQKKRKKKKHNKNNAGHWQIENMILNFKIQNWKGGDHWRIYSKCALFQMRYFYVQNNFQEKKMIPDKKGSVTHLYCFDPFNGSNEGRLDDA